MSLIFHIYLSHLTITVRKIHFGPHFAIQVSFIVTISNEWILGPSKYDQVKNYFS